MPFLSSLPDDAKLSAVFALKPERYQPLLAFTQDIMRGDSELSAGERELIAALNQPSPGEEHGSEEQTEIPDPDAPHQQPEEPETDDHHGEIRPAA